MYGYVYVCMYVCLYACVYVCARIYARVFSLACVYVRLLFGIVMQVHMCKANAMCLCLPNASKLEVPMPTSLAKNDTYHACITTTQTSIKPTLV